jgi:predicted esterase
MDATYRIEVPATFQRSGEGEGKPLLLVAHGYSDTGASFLRRALPAPPARFELLAPNGPFPVPQRVDGEWKTAYSWYFADLSANRIVIHPRVAAGAVAALVRDLGLAARAKVLVGFSQGGYFLPHLARELETVRHLIVVGAGFHPEYFGGIAARVDHLHGDQDDVIPLAEARADFARLPRPGEEIVIEGMGHSPDEAGRRALLGLLERAPV